VEEEYGYIIDPDLVRVAISDSLKKKVKDGMPELAHDKVKKFIEKHKIDKEDAEIIAAEKELAEMLEKVAEEVNPVLAAKWIRRELRRVLNYNKKTLEDAEITSKHLVDLLQLIEKKAITEKTGQRLIEKLIEKPFDILSHVEKEGLAAVTSVDAIEKFCKEAISENAKAVTEYKEGIEKAFNFLVGQVMRKSRGKATPKEVNEILKKLLK